MIQELRLRNFLSFGPETPALQLGPLNVLIGPNGSGKSNLLEAFGLLRATTGDLWQAIRSQGSTSDWIWKGRPTPFTAEIIARGAVEYQLAFCDNEGEFMVLEEAITTVPDGKLAYRSKAGKAVLHDRSGVEHEIDLEEFDFHQSILIQRRDPGNYPELTKLANRFAQIRTYRGWPTDLYSSLRASQRMDGPKSYLLEDGSNLALVLNRLSNDAPAWHRVRTFLKDLGQDFDDIRFDFVDGAVRLLIHESTFTTPSSRLSDGTLRFLCLLAVLLDPKPSPLICIDEPELGFHPDAVHEVAELLKDASTRTQLVITTHSRELLDALSDHPESVIVCERKNGQTEMRRLGSPELMEWAKTYGIGKAWREGEFGGNRW